MTPLRRLRPFDFSGRRLPPGRADRFQASVRNGRSCAGLPYRLWQLRHGLRAFTGGPVDPDFAQLRPARSRVGEMSRTKSVPGIALGQWCRLGQTHYWAVDPARVPRPVSDSKNGRAAKPCPAPHIATPGLMAVLPRRGPFRGPGPAEVGPVPRRASVGAGIRCHGGIEIGRGLLG